jgi:hypothetical protein
VIARSSNVDMTVGSVLSEDGTHATLAHDWLQRFAEHEQA